MEGRHRSLVAIVLLSAVLTSCTRSPRASTPSLRPSPSTTSATSIQTSVPPVPAESGKGAPDQPPIIWIGGTLTEVWTDRLVIREPLGSVLTLRRLAKGATAFYRIVGDRWDRVAAASPSGTGGQACVETALDGTNLLALRVFLGAGCGPAG